MNDYERAQSIKRYREQVAEIEAQGHTPQSTWTPEELIHGVHVIKADSPEAREIEARAEAIRKKHPERFASAKDAEKQKHLDSVSERIDADNAAKFAKMHAQADSEESEESDQLRIL